MTFIENLKKKITADQLVRQVFVSLTPIDSGRHTDLEAMAKLLEMAGYQSRPMRDMTLFCPDFSIQPNKIMVLDNELPLYKTIVPDVLIRKSPTIKEMVSIRNAIKILSDKDVVLAKGKPAVEMIRQEIMDGLDLAYGQADVETIYDMGTAGLETADAEAMVLCLRLFSELLDLLPVPAYPTPKGLLALYQKGGVKTGDLTSLVLIYDRMENQLGLFDGSRTRTAGKIVSRRELAEDLNEAAYQGKDVLEWLRDRVLESMPPVRIGTGAD